MSIPFEGIAAVFLFIIGVPAFVLQFISPEERRVVLRVPFWRDNFLFIGAAFVIVTIVLVFRTNIAGLVGEQWVWGWMYILLLLIVTCVAIYIPTHYGRREQIIKDLKKRASRRLQKQGSFEESALLDLIKLGKQCESGQDRELVLGALDELVEQACNCTHYRAGMLQTILDETVNMIIFRPHPEEFQSFPNAISLLTRIVTFKHTSSGLENLVDHQRAVLALSILGQTVLSQIGYSTGVDNIMMGYEEALSLALLNHPELLTDVSNALLETGAAALASKNYLFAVAALRRLLSICEENDPVPAETRVDTLGLLAHFWTANDDDGSSSRFFAKRCLERLKWEGGALQSALEQARQHCLSTMEFETADKIMVMARELKEP